MGTFANSEDPDEMQDNAAFHQGLRCLLRFKQPLTRKKILLLTPKSAKWTIPYFMRKSIN